MKFSLKNCMKFSARALAKILGAVVAIAISLMVLYEVFAGNAALQKYGLPGIFLVALLSHLSIVARGIFLPALLSLTEFYSPFLLGFVAGLGGAFGEVTAYYWGSGIRDALDSPRRGVVQPRMAERYGLILMLLFASSPLPDTPIILLAGSLRFPLWKVIVIQFIGKISLYTAGTYIGGFIFMEFKSILEYELASTLLLAISLILCILISWRRSREKILKIVDRVIAVFFKTYRK